MKLRRVRWVAQQSGESKTKEGWFHQFIPVMDGDQYVVAGAIIELDDGKIEVLDAGHVCDWYELQFVDPYSVKEKP